MRLQILISELNCRKTGMAFPKYRLRALGYIDVAKFLMYSVPGFQLLKIDPF
jgi:hypothetical protein